MERKGLSRRGFIAGTVGAAAATRLAQAQSGNAETPRPGALRLGAPIFVKSDDPEVLARAHRDVGYRAAYCPEVSLSDAARIRAIYEAFAKEDVVIAEVGRWCNLLDPDADKRAKNLKTVTDGLALAEAIGARCCVDIAGSFNPDVWYGPHPGNFTSAFFDAAVENARKIIDAVKPSRAKFCYEMMGWAMPDNVDCYLKMLKAVDRDGFGVHLDVCNLINCPERFYRNTDLINDCFDKLGPWITSCHAKDLVWDVEMNIHFREVRPGAGSVDYRAYLKRLAALPQQAPLMIEHLSNAEEYDAARNYLQQLALELGLSFDA